MNQPKHSRQHWLLVSSLIPFTISISIPVSVLLTAIASHAAVPKAFFVTRTSGNSILLERGRTSESAAAWRTQLRDYHENLFVPKGTTSNATLTGISAPSGVAVTSKHLIGPTAYVRSQSLDSRYRFPCTLKGGEGLLGWRPSQNRDDRGCVPQGVRIRAGQGGGTAFLPLQAPIIATKQVLKAQRLPDLLLGLVRVQYCSAIGDNGTGWGVRSTDSMGLLGSGDPCEKALKDCLQTSSGDDCSVVSTWEWKASDRDLMASLDCDDNRKFNARGNGWVIASTLLLKLKETANAIGAKSCTFDVYAPGEVIVAPATDQLTLIQFRRSGSQLVIDAIRGDVIVKSAEDPDGRTVSQGFSYAGGSYDGDRYFPNRQPLQRFSARELSDSAIVQSFLETSPTVSDADVPEDVINEIAAQNKEFQEALRQSLNSD
ncbi:hypothetical protein C7B65_24580 [Phormidesmis priestleyi ULC007]|uniref:Uncharacterized protein n=1 Tax=Phormidesmis priestleyi ULC007 TaxID=1920490 RepID=A0A2T1D4E5_9CYAN|nr:hypothetical protein [Phormidesmis priestleyi]PSB15349.1 hypothetical protein C7B65_24580 [Phormidesmis priestleyi ULC007]PZO51600.1 MAG: hypothetical protein DCF14_08870 [Phormidesmis priestleyi]